MILLASRARVVFAAAGFGLCLAGEASAWQQEFSGVNVQTGRLFRNAIASTCANKAHPGFNAGTPNVETFPYRNTSAAAQCVTFLFDPTVGDAPCFTNSHLQVHAPNYNAGDQATNFLGDVGNSLKQLMSVTIPANTTAALVVTNTTTAAICDFAVTQEPNDIAADLGSGPAQRLNNAGSWQNLHPTSPSLIGVGNLDGNLQDELLAVVPSGLWARFNNSGSFTNLHATAPTVFTTGDLDGNGQDEVIGSFGASGLWALYNNNGVWVQLNPAQAEDLEVADIDGAVGTPPWRREDLIVDFGAGGLWARLNNSSWTKLDNSSPQHIAAGDLDDNSVQDLIADFGAAGLRVRYNNTTWTNRHPSATQGLATGDLNANPGDELVVDFGASGLWAFENNTSWSKLNNSSPVHFTLADLDNTHVDEVIADFGAAITARDNNAGAFVQIHNVPSQGLVAGAFD